MDKYLKEHNYTEERSKLIKDLIFGNDENEGILDLSSIEIDIAMEKMKKIVEKEFMDYLIR